MDGPTPDALPKPAAHNDVSAQDDIAHALFHSEIGLVEIIAKQISHSINGLVDMDELMNAGREGLFEAARKFDPDQGVQFRTYANYRVRGAIIDAVRQATWLPRRMLEGVRALQAVGQICEGAVAHVFKDIDADATFESPREALRDQLSGLVAAATIAVEACGGEDDEPHVALAGNPEEAYARSELLQLVRTTLNEMGELEANVVRHYYFEHRDLETTAAALGIRAPWASRLLSRAIARLAKRLRDQS